MTQPQDGRGRPDQSNQFKEGRWKVMVTVIGLTLPLMTDMAPNPVEAFTQFRPDNSQVEREVNCWPPTMKLSPTFVNLQGSATYPFSSVCYPSDGPGGMQLFWEGRWNPSETRSDRPNAVETLFIEGYEDFLPNRQGAGLSRGRGAAPAIFVYWTARCNADPWLQGGSCYRLGAYVPDDVRASIPDLDSRRFPLTGDGIPAARKPVLIQQYKAANTPVSAVQSMTTQPLSEQQRVQSMMIQPQQSQVMTQSQRTQAMTVQPQQSQTITQAQRNQAMTVQPQAAIPKPDSSVSALARSGIFSRGVEEKEGQAPGQQETSAQPESAEAEVMAVVVEGTPDILEPVTVTLDRALHITTAKGETVEVKTGIYEIGTIMDLQLGLAKEGQPTVLLNTQRDTHNIPIHRTIAVLIPGPSDDVHLLFLTPDGKRFTAIGYGSEVKSRSTHMTSSLSDKAIKDAVAAADAKPRSVSSPACQLNPAEIGPRWIPVPCTMPTIPAPAPSP